jgi:type II secretory pathway component PulM
MSPRDRRLFLGLVIACYGGAVFMAFWLGSGFLSDLDSRVDTRDDALMRLSSMEADYVRNADQVAAIEDSLRQNANQDFQSYVERAAATVGVTSNLKSVREKGVSELGTLQEKTYAVELDRVTVQQLSEFLFELEAGGFPLRIRTSRIKGSGQAGSRVVTASLELSAFRLNEQVPLAPGGAP